MNDREAVAIYQVRSLQCISSSIVKGAPHLGHLIFVCFLVIPAQPKESAAKTAITKKILANFRIS
jgi:hypothetical protein